MSALTHDALARAGGAGDEQVRHLARGRPRRPCPTTSRPRAKVSLLVGVEHLRVLEQPPEARRSLTHWLGISMPTTSLPGIGASMRMVRAARAIARSSARPSMRDSFTCASGLTSYWVTTGPVFVADDRGRDLEAASFSSMIRMLPRGSPGSCVTGAVGQRSSSSVDRRAGSYSGRPGGGAVARPRAASTAVARRAAAAPRPARVATAAPQAARHDGLAHAGPALGTGAGERARPGATSAGSGRSWRRPTSPGPRRRALRAWRPGRPPPSGRLGDRRRRARDPAAPERGAANVARGAG